MTEELNDERSVSSSTICVSPDTKCQRYSATAWKEECGESVPREEHPVEKAIICSCCRKRNEAAKLNEPVEVSKLRKECDAGDTIDTPPTRDDKFEIATSKKNDVCRTHQRETRASKEKLCPASDVSLCFTSCNACQRNYDTRAQCDIQQMTSVQEQNDEECDDSVGMINHKDSLCILVEKYKSNKKCNGGRSISDETETLEGERNKNECNKSLSSEISCQPKAKENFPDLECAIMSSAHRCRQNCLTSDEKIRGHACRKAECNQFKNLRSRFVNGTCCTTKGTPWRHSF